MSNRFKTNQGVSVCKDAKNRANVATFAPFSAVPSSPEPQIEDGNRKKQPSSSREGPGEDGGNGKTGQAGNNGAESGVSR